MASKRALQLLPRITPRLLSTSTPAIRQCTRTQIASVQRNVYLGRISSGTLQQKRYHSAFPSDTKSKAYEFDDVRAMIENPSNTTLLIDVREPHEFAANTIPTSINLPVTSQPDALLLEESEFMDRFGWKKPPKEKEVVFFCKAGVRSRAAAQLAKQAGYENVGEYRGSWLDWERRGGPGTCGP